MLLRVYKNFRLTLKKHFTFTTRFHNKTNLVMNKVSQKQSTAKISSQATNYNLKDVTKFEILPSPVKSFSDKKEYKVIRLENGLTACLISDMAEVTDVNSILSQDTNSESEESDNEDLTESDSDSAESAEDYDEREEDDVKTIKKVHDEEKLAAAALCIGVGSFSDPKEVPGLAHFLEHMVFMGSSKYPQENDFDSFIKKHGGSDNACTDYETTTFYFECFEKHLHQSMDKFAQFFISPLMKKDSMTREREAVESEFQMAVPSDDYRKEQLLASLSEDSSPVNSFSWGNLITLKENISDDKLYEKLHEFRKRHYSAHRMTLAVQARLPIEMLESYVINCFSEVPSNNMPPNDFKLYSESIFDTPKFKRLFYVKPVKDSCEVHLTWVMPSLQHMYKSKPHVYVSWLLAHEGKGSLLAYLKKKVWALSLYAGNEESGAEFNSMYASFSVNIVLTKQGFDHLSEVIEAVFSYLQLLKDLGPNERIFKEIQSIKELSFRFEEDESASDNVEFLVECMHYYPPEDYLTGSELFFEYNPEAINMVLNNLVPDKMNIIILSSSVPDDVVFDKVEPWFKTQYCDKEISLDWVSSWLKAKPLPDFTLPEPNQFLTEDFSLLPIEENIPEYPERILKSPLIELWYRKDQKFGLPMAYYYYYLTSPFSTESQINCCMTQMFVTFVNINLAEEAFAAQIAELSYKISACEKGICVKVSGFNEKLPMLIDLIVKNLKSVATNLTNEIFEAVKEKQSETYHNGFLKPSKLCKDVRLSIIQNNYYSSLERYYVVSEISYDSMKKFSDEVLRNLYIRGLIQGNVTIDTALNTTKQFVEKLNCESLYPNDSPKITVNELPKGPYYCRTISFDENNTNSVITNYYQCGPITIKDNVILEFIMLMIEEPLFDILRTKEQLGYSIYSTIRDTFGILGYSITVNTQADKHTVQYVDSRIEAFLKYSIKLLKKMTEKKFAQTKKDLIKVKKVVDVDLEDEVDRNWEEILNRKYMFDRLSNEINAIEELKIGEVRKWWEKHNTCTNNDNYRKLSIQVEGHIVSKGKSTAQVEAGNQELEVANAIDNANAIDTAMQLIKYFATESSVRNTTDLNTGLKLEEVENQITLKQLELDPSKYFIDENSSTSRNANQSNVTILSTEPVPDDKKVLGTSSVEKRTFKLNLLDDQKEVAKKGKAKSTCSVEKREYKLILLDDQNEVAKKGKAKNYFITDIDSFKKELKVFLDPATTTTTTI